MPFRLRRAAAMAGLSPKTASTRTLAGRVFEDPPAPVSMRSLTRRQAQSFDLEAWLLDHPEICNAIVWETADGAETYPDWPAARKAELAGAFRTAWRGDPTGLDDPPPNQYSLEDDEFPRTFLSRDDAWALFKALVGQSLAVEVGDAVGWSFAEYDGPALARVLDGRETFERSDGDYELVHQSVPAPPDVALSFLRDEDLVAGDRRATLGRVLDWCRQHLVHFTGGPYTKQMVTHWQYRGYPPASRVISGTVRTQEYFDERRHYTAGCWGTSSFLHALLRVVNVPVDVLGRGGHTLPHFVGEDRYLSHGDDPYNKLAYATPPIPATELLIGPGTFEEWFGEDEPRETHERNVGRRMEELAVEYLPNKLVEKHCEDREAGNSHAESEVYHLYDVDEFYSVADLEAKNLWERLDDKVARFGGCDSLPWQE